MPVINVVFCFLKKKSSVLFEGWHGPRWDITHFVGVWFRLSWSQEHPICEFSHKIRAQLAPTNLADPGHPPVGRAPHARARIMRKKRSSGYSVVRVEEEGKLAIGVEEEGGRGDELHARERSRRGGRR